MSSTAAGGPINLLTHPQLTSLTSLGVTLPPSPIDDHLALSPALEAPRQGASLLFPPGGPSEVNKVSEVSEGSRGKVGEVKRSVSEQIAIERQRSEVTTEMKTKLDEIEQTLEKKLYHEFFRAASEYITLNTHLIAKLTHLTQSLKYTNIDFVMCVVKPHFSKLSDVQFVYMLHHVVALIEGIEALKFLEVFIEGFAPLPNSSSKSDAFVLFSSVKAYHLAISNSIKPCETLLEALDEYLSHTFGIDVKISACYHRAAAAMHKHKNNHDLFYKDALLFLAYTPLGEIAPSNRAALALEVCVSALVADNVYNFGELVQQPLLVQLAQQPNQSLWVFDLVSAFNAGSLVSFDEVANRHKDKIAANPALHQAQSDGSLRRKATLLTLAELAFQRGKKKRVFSFTDIAQACCVNVNEVEVLAMKAMSANLMKGDIDQVDRVVRVTWVRPRILDTARIEVMRTRMESWTAQAERLLTQVGEMTPELIGQE